MRVPAVLLLVALLAGCAQPAGDAGGANNSSSNSSADLAMLPPPINDTKSVQGGAEPISNVAGPACSTPGAKCFRYPFELNSTAQITATLTWGSPASDFDLFVFQEGKPTDKQSACCTPPQPHQQEKIEATLDPGKYEVVVSAASVAQDSFKISVTFASGA